jgi:hypothetical protein
LARGGGAGCQACDELGAVAIGEEADIVLEQFRQHPPLIVGDDPVADARQHQRLAIGGHRLDHEDHGGHQSEDDDPRKVLVHIGLVDDVADQICAERGAPGGDHHQAECERVAPPLAGRLFHQEAPDQRSRAVGIGEQSLKIRSEHARSVARRHGPRRGSEPFLPRRQRFSSGIGEACEISRRAAQACVPTPVHG